MVFIGDFSKKKIHFFGGGAILEQRALTRIRVLPISFAGTLAGRVT
jgi:hypothetical protein